MLDKVKDMGPRSANFLQEVWSEIKKVHWPSRKETYAATGVVLVIVTVIAIYLALVDMALSQVVRFLLGAE